MDPAWRSTLQGARLEFAMPFGGSVPDPAPVIERTCALDPVALSAREARAFVRQLLDEAGHPEWVDASDLAVSEVVTNAVLHAHTPVEVTARVDDDGLRV